MNRFCYRCTDCLFVVFTEESVSGAECEACGGKFEYMGRVAPKGRRLYEVVTQCACDGRCTGAVGPSCDCSCGGVNHGSGAVVRVIKDQGAVPRLAARDADKQLAAAVEYRNALRGAQGRLGAEFGSSVEAYKNGFPRLHWETYNEIRQAYRGIAKAKALRTRGGRLKALARVCSEASGHTCNVTQGQAHQPEREDGA
jgi:hypothetical protein